MSKVEQRLRPWGSFLPNSEALDSSSTSTSIQYVPTLASASLWWGSVPILWLPVGLGFSPCPTSTRLLSAQKHQPKAFFLLHAHPRDLLALWPGPWRVAPHLSLQCVPVAPVVFLGLQAVIGEKVRIEGSPPRPSLSPTWTCSDQLSPRMSSSSRWADWVCSPSE